MKTRVKKISLAAVVVLLLAMVAGCGAAANESAPDTRGGISVIDMMGREVTLDAPAEKVVALTASDCEIIYALGAGERVVGRGEYCDYPAKLLDVPSVQSGAGTNVEQIIAMAPQVVFMSSMAQAKEQVEQLAGAGIAVVVSEAYDIAGTYQSIRMIGAILGKDAEADALVQEMQAGFEEIAGLVDNVEEGQSIYFEVSPLEYGLWTAGPNTFYQEIADLLQVENIFADLGEPFAEISEEQVIERDPDIIVTIGMYYGDGPTPEDEIAARPGWQGIGAVQNGRVFAANGDELSRPANRLVNGARALYEFIYEQNTRA